jgi:hypothetical protein
MAKGIQNYPQIDTANPTAYPNGNIKDAPSGTPVNVITNADLHQTFDKLLREVGTTANNTPDNETNGFQYVKAMLQMLPNKYIWETTTEGDGDIQTITRASIQSAAAMNSLPISVGAADFARKIGSASSNKLIDWQIQCWIQFNQTGDYEMLIVGNSATYAQCRPTIDSATGDIQIHFNISGVLLSNIRIILIG